MRVLDVALEILHIVVIVINTTFWMSWRTLRLAQITLLLTFVSWFGFGFFYGFGYCFLTDIHWNVKEALGETDLPASYIKYGMDRLTGRDWSPLVIDIATGTVISLSFIGCLVQTLRQARGRNRHGDGGNGQRSAQIQ